MAEAVCCRARLLDSTTGQTATETHIRNCIGSVSYSLSEANQICSCDHNGLDRFILNKRVSYELASGSYLAERVRRQRESWIGNHVKNHALLCRTRHRR